jgi:hypothetical protein
MKQTLFLIVVAVSLAISPATFPQSSNPVRDPRPSPGKIEPRPTPGKAPAGPRQLPKKLQVLSLAYAPNLPGARITIKNVGGETADTELTLILLATKKTNGAWPNLAGKLPTYYEVRCPYSWKSTAVEGLWSEYPPVLSGRGLVSDLKVGQSVTVNIKFDTLADQKMDVGSSLVDFAAKWKCGPPVAANESWSDYKYFITVHGGIHYGLYGAVYLNP